MFIFTYVPENVGHDLDILPGWRLLLVEVVDDDSGAHPAPLHPVVQVLGHGQARVLFHDSLEHERKVSMCLL